MTELILTHYFISSGPNIEPFEHALCVHLGDGNVVSGEAVILSTGEETVTCPNCLAFLETLPLGM